MLLTEGKFQITLYNPLTCPHESGVVQSHRLGGLRRDPRDGRKDRTSEPDHEGPGGKNDEGYSCRHGRRISRTKVDFFIILVKIYVYYDFL